MTMLYRDGRFGLQQRVFGRADRRQDGQSQSMPRVQCGWYQAGAGRHLPLWAYSIPQLNEEERQRAELLKLLWPADAEVHARLRARFARLREELRNQTAGRAHAIELEKRAHLALDARRPAAPIAPAAAPARPAPILPPVTAPTARPAAAPRPQAAPPVLHAPAPAQNISKGPPDPPRVAKPSSLGAEIAQLIAELQQVQKLKAAETAPDIAPPPAPKPAAMRTPVPAAPIAKARSPAAVPKVKTAQPMPQPRPEVRKIRRVGLLEEFRQALRVRTSYRSRRPCPTCGGETHYIASLSTMVSGLYRRVCKSCAYREPGLVKIHEVDKDGFVSAG